MEVCVQTIEKERKTYSSTWYRPRIRTGSYSRGNQSKGYCVLGAGLLIALMLFLCPSKALSQPILYNPTVLSWNANSESDLAGYKLYYGFVGGPYTFFLVNIPLNALPNPLAPRWNIDTSSIPEEISYVFVLTAYDNAGNESGYSNETKVFRINRSKPDSPTGLSIEVSVNVNINVNNP